MKIAIRDDDVCFWSKPQELDSVYGELWKQNIPISLAIIPFAVRSHFPENRNAFYQETDCLAIGENNLLVDFLRKKISENKVSIMLHGYSHQYLISDGNLARAVFATKENISQFNSKKKIVWHGEYAWKSYEQLTKETLEGKRYLEDLLETNITVFVPPSNEISSVGVRAIIKSGLNISGSIRLSKFNRPFSFKCMQNWFKKLCWRMLYSTTYPFPMKYDNNVELDSFSLVPGVTFADLKGVYCLANKKHANLSLATHYWEVLKVPELKSTLLTFLNEVQKNNNIEFSVLGDLFNDK